MQGDLEEVVVSNYRLGASLVSVAALAACAPSPFYYADADDERVLVCTDNVSTGSHLKHRKCRWIGGNDVETEKGWAHPVPVKDRSRTSASRSSPVPEGGCGANTGD